MVQDPLAQSDVNFFSGGLVLDLQRFQQTPGEERRETPSLIQIINESKVLPSVLGSPEVSGVVSAPEAPYVDVSSIFDEGVETYIESLSYRDQDAFFSLFDTTTRTNTIVPELSLKTGQSGSLFGLVKSITGDPFGIIGEGFKILDVASQATEQAQGFLFSYLTQGWGNDLSMGERWDAGKLYYEGVFNGLDEMKTAWSLAARDDKGFDEYLKAQQGGWVDMGLKMILDPLWLVGGMPLVPGAIRMTKISKLEGVASFLQTGIRADSIGGVLTGLPVAGKLFSKAGTTLDAMPIVGSVLRGTIGAFGMPIESKAARETLQEVAVALNVSKKLTDSVELSRALKEVGNPGWIKSLFSIQPQRASEDIAGQVDRLMTIAAKNVESPADLRILMTDWKNGVNLPNALSNQRVGKMFQIINRMEFEKFDSLNPKSFYAGDDWRLKFIDEVRHGAGRATGTPGNTLLDISKGVYGAENIGALNRMLGPIKWGLGVTLLNRPAYTVLNIMNNTFTTMFDAIDSFDNAPYESLGVISSRFGVFRGRHNDFMTAKFDEGWKETRDGVALGRDWMEREFGLVRDKKGAPKHLWDNAAFNFGVRTASFFDSAARRTSAEFAMLRADHYTAKAGAVFPNIKDEFTSIIDKDYHMPTLVKNRDKISRGEVFGEFAAVKIRNEMFSGIDDTNTRHAMQETLETHLGGQMRAIEDEIVSLIQANDLEGARNVLAKSKAEMKMYAQRANRISNVGTSSPPVKYESIFDAHVMDYAQQADEFTHWTTQMGLMMRASGAIDPMGVGLVMNGMTYKWGAYSEMRQQLVDDFTATLAEGNINASRLALDELENQTKVFHDRIKADIDSIVNRLAKVDITQARAFNDASRRYLDSLRAPEDAFRSALRRTYHPRRVGEEEAFNAIKDAMDTRATEVRGLFDQNIEDFRVGGFAPDPVLSEAPMMSDRFNTYERVWEKYANHMEANLGRLAGEADNLRSTTDLESLVKWIDEEVAPRMIDYQFANERFVRHMTDFSMLDYTHQYGFEKYTQMVFPYEFWPTRTAWHWAQRAWAKPGAVNGLYNILEFQQEWQAQVDERYMNQIREQLKDVNLSPEVRLQLEAELENGSGLAARMRKLTIPVPFLQAGLNAIGISGDYNTAPIPFIGGRGIEVAFDPYAAMFPLADWSRDFEDYTPRADNWLGRQWQGLKNTGLSLNPFVSTVGQLTGILPEGEEAFSWLRNGGPPAFIALGQSAAGRAFYRWASLGDEGPMAKLEEAVGVPIREFFFENGYGPEGLLSYLAAEITGADPRDKKNFELFGTSRVLASLAAEDTRLLALEQERKNRKMAGENASMVDADINARREGISMEYVKAYHDQSGPLWEKARKGYADVEGLRNLTSYFMGMGGINVWQRGEVIQEGLDFLNNAVMQAGNDAERQAFFDLFPEYTPKRIQDTVLNDQVGAREIARQSLWFHNSELIQKTYEGRITELNGQIEAIDQQIAGIESAGLNLRVNREARSGLFDTKDALRSKLDDLYDQRNKDYDQLDALYGKPINSLSKNPWERALDNYAEEWYATYRIEDDTARKAAQDKFLASFAPNTQGNTHLDWLSLGVQAAAVREQTRRSSFGIENEAARKLREKMGMDIEALTNEAAARVNARDIREHLGLKESGPPSASVAEYRMAVGLFQQYKALELLGLSKEEERKQKKEFWDSNPLLERYYGTESYFGSIPDAIYGSLQRWNEIFDGAPAEEGDARSAYFKALNKEIEQLRAVLEPEGLVKPEDPNSVRLGQLWDEYFSLPEKSQARRDFMTANKEEIDRLNNVLGNKPMSESQSFKDVSREGQIWDHYYSLPSGDARTAYLLMVQGELNGIRARLGKEPINNVGFIYRDPRMSESAPVTSRDLIGALPQ